VKVPVQPSVNIGVTGHVDHGKTQLVYKLTGDKTDRHSEEIRRGISIRLGYADASFHKCPKEEGALAYSTKETCAHCGSKTEFLRSVSFVDAPGHETLMATMLSGAAIMNGALLVIAANEECPQPQTREHLMALGIIGVEKIVVVQNKVDIVTEAEALENQKQIQAFVKGTVAEGAPIIPISAQHDVNIDVLIQTMEAIIPTPTFDAGKPPRMYVSRSFDINKPGSAVEDFAGGVLGGSLLQGTLKVGDEVEIVPGVSVTHGAKQTWHGLTTQVVSLHTGGSARKEVKPGGLIAVRTDLDPSLTKSDSLVGRVIGPKGTLPAMVAKLSLEVHLLDRVVGVAEDVKVEGVKTNEPLMVSVGTATTVGVVTSARGKHAEMNLKIPVAAEAGQRVAISRRVAQKWHLIGHGVLK